MTVMITFIFGTIGSSISAAHADTLQNWLLIKVKAIADQGSLSNIEATGRILHTSFVENRSVSTGEDCHPEGSFNFKASKFQTFSPSSDFWFRSQPEGALNVRPPQTSGTVLPTQEPHLTYSVTHRVYCAYKDHPPREDNEADMTFDAIQGFSCITQPQLESVFHSIKFIVVADGPPLFNYTGRFTEQEGSQIDSEFDYRSHCLKSMHITYSTEDNLRSRRARVKFNECESKQVDKIRSTGKNPDYVDMSIFCRTFQDYLDAEPRQK